MIDELVGQLVWAFISAAEDVESVVRAARRGRIGGTWLLPTEMHSAAQVEKAVAHARAAGWVALLHCNRVRSFDPDAVLASDELAALIDGVAAAAVPVVMVSMGSPYVLPRFRGAAARLCACAPVRLQRVRRLVARDAPCPERRRAPQRAAARRAPLEWVL